ncbi:MAG: PhoPQ-activated pathogenicity-related family protein [Candidatus Thiodiazotropha lotti]|uniref:PhoPQ-activated protein PqaA family protein n=1 Tax=Candidatus Thiodiazotropha endoloripes TaxID=1818881 RepID=UPI00083DBDA1|nr:PhoPQ-activated protein PqaA family protein [Candidatus Thiodiazotropha endoloripes]MCG7992494.1 PhoPQ-activated pathogenicity-related family protein [Candidatus Thiodiazotropha lotti]MCW4184152.1 PhoPQ-activated pathogenicity-related family protein [Candidatus Thiodiazotropha weberae]MCG7999935.1 PhoPQ-activated pathogenicity-related family protein [Candidatus Thiodiazotropha lotti]MCW4191704.1 PhoPQ-activated pathogenicity-related family protein [Candidatus Thiodiazotropha weberae]ODB9247
MIRMIVRSLLSVVLMLLYSGLIQAQQSNPLKEYVYQDDPAYTYRVIGQLPGAGYDAYFLNMDSQNWRSEAEVTPTLWNHWVTLIVPHQLTATTANLTIVGSSFSTTPPDAHDLALLVPLQPMLLVIGISSSGRPTSWLSVSMLKIVNSWRRASARH